MNFPRHAPASDDFQSPCADRAIDRAADDDAGCLELPVDASFRADDDAGIRVDVSLYSAVDVEIVAEAEVADKPCAGGDDG